MHCSFDGPLYVLIDLFQSLKIILKKLSDQPVSIEPDDTPQSVVINLGAHYL